MTERAIFNRKYSSFNSGGTEVWLVTGAGITTQPDSTISLTAGETLAQGDFVRLSGTYAVKASALSGLATASYKVIGATAESATINNAVLINTDGIVRPQFFKYYSFGILGSRNTVLPVQIFWSNRTLFQFFWLSYKFGHQPISSACPRGQSL